MAALAYERGRQESEHRNRRFRRRLSPSIAADFSQEGHHIDKNVAASNNHSEEHNGKAVEKSSAESNSPFAAGNTRESLEASAKSSLRNTFEHGSDIDVVHRVRSTRSLTASPPLGPTSGDGAIASHSTVASFFRHLNEPQATLADSPDLHPLVSEVGTRLTTASIFSNHDTISASDGAASAALDSSLNTPRSLQGRYVTTSAGVALGTSPLDIVIDRQQGETQLNNAVNKYAETEIEVRSCVVCLPQCMFTRNVHISSLFMFRWIVRLRPTLMLTQNQTIFHWMTRRQIEAMDLIPVQHTNHFQRLE